MNATAASPGTGSRILDDIAEVIGEAAALTLALEFRGQKFYVPQDPAGEPRIAKAIGEDLARQFCSVFWRLTLYLPFREALRREVHRLAATDMTRREIAGHLHIAERQVYRWLESPPVTGEGLRGRGDDRQIELF